MACRASTPGPVYHSVFLQILPLVTQDISEDAWVLGRPSRILPRLLRGTTKLRRDVIGLYLDDYVRRWDAMLADIAIKPFGNLHRPRHAQPAVRSGLAPAGPAAIDRRADAAEPCGRVRPGRRQAWRARRREIGEKAAGFAAFQARSGLTLPPNRAGKSSSARRSEAIPRASRSIRPQGSMTTSRHCMTSWAARRHAPGLEATLAKVQQTVPEPQFRCERTQPGPSAAGPACRRRRWSRRRRRATAGTDAWHASTRRGNAAEPSNQRNAGRHGRCQPGDFRRLAVEGCCRCATRRSIVTHWSLRVRRMCQWMISPGCSARAA